MECSKKKFVNLCGVCYVNLIKGSPFTRYPLYQLDNIRTAVAEIVSDDHRMPCGKQCNAGVRTYITGAADDENIQIKNLPFTSSRSATFSRSTGRRLTIAQLSSGCIYNCFTPQPPPLSFSRITT